MYLFIFFPDNLTMCFDFNRLPKCIQQYKIIFNNLLFIIIDLLFSPHSLNGSLCMKIFSCFYIQKGALAMRYLGVLGIKYLKIIVIETWGWAFPDFTLQPLKTL